MKICRIKTDVLMLQYGLHITQKEDPLEKILPSRFYHSLINPRPHIEQQIRRLERVRTLDEKQYSRLKVELPYVVCGIFNPPIRRLENFGYIEYFVLDFDHLSEKGLSINEVKKRLKVDERVMLMFASPGGDGLKVMFRLKERCYDAVAYSMFYKRFALSFSKQHDMDQAVDSRTSDVTRACFLSIDREAFWREDATAIEQSMFPEISETEMIGHFKREYKEQRELYRETKARQEIEKEVLKEIKERLNGRQVISKSRPEIKVPDHLNEVMPGLTAYLLEVGIEVVEVINIQYGKQIKMKAGGLKSEINLYAKQRIGDFSVVKSCRTGTSAELNDLTAEHIRSYLQYL